ncbi:MAG: NAD(P)/FAD-dependent oxidoreductase [Actinomycetota bacterium]
MGVIETDYLIVGAGCVGMSFADVFVDECDADVVIVDEHAKPGGHWNDAYPFVTLHQPSSFYGVSSAPLGRDRVDDRGWNAGLGELATGAEVANYFDNVMRDHLLPTGRVRYFPMSRYTDGRITSLVSGAVTEITARTRIVDTTHLKTTVPSTHTPSFDIDEGVRFMPLNDLPTVGQPPTGWVIVGGGKTGIDACLWLLEHGVDPDAITWIMPRDGWLIPRETTQLGPEHFATVMGAQAAQYEAAAAATSVDDLFARLEAGGVLVRLDPSVEPQMFHAATVSAAELAALRTIRNVVRLGRVGRIGPDRIELRDGALETTPDHVHVDCSASAIPKQEPVTIFDGHVLTPQTVRAYQPAFSAAVIAWVEAHYDDDDMKNEICGIVPIPNDRTDWIGLTIANALNMRRWMAEPELSAFLSTNRLNGFAAKIAEVDPDDEEKQAVLARLRQAIAPGVMNLMRLSDE